MATRVISAQPAEQGRGTLYGAGAYLFWGLTPLYWKLLAGLPALELLAHRVLWAALMLWGALWLRSRRGLGTLAALRERGVALTLAASTLLIAINWLLFILAVLNDRVLEASLGYYINPLLNVALGRLLLGEQLSRRQAVAVGLAAAGVLILTLSHGSLPWIALLLAASFGLYGLLRKGLRADALLGLAVETGLLAPLALGWLLWLGLTGGGHFLRAGTGTSLLLLAAGAVTAAPLLAFGAAARRLPLTSLGFLQYLAPSMQFLLAVLVFHEPFGRAQLAAFGCIWLALALYSSQLLRDRRRPPANGAGTAVPPAQADVSCDR